MHHFRNIHFDPIQSLLPIVVVAAGVHFAVDNHQVEVVGIDKGKLHLDTVDIVAAEGTVEAVVDNLLLRKSAVVAARLQVVEGKMPPH